MKEKTWVAVCDGNRARVLEMEPLQGPWRQVWVLELSVANRDSSDALSFARDLCRRLTHAFDNRKYTRLVLVAPPHFLGVLNQQLPERIASRIFKAIRSDLTHLSPSQLEERLEDHGL